MHSSQPVISAATKPTFEIATSIKTIEITFRFDVALSKILFDLIVKIIEIPLIILLPLNVKYLWMAVIL